MVCRNEYLTAATVSKGLSAEKNHRKFTIARLKLTPAHRGRCGHGVKMHQESEAGLWSPRQSSQWWVPGPAQQTNSVSTTASQPIQNEFRLRP